MTIHRVLIANRGEIASRIARTAHNRGIDVVAVFADSDRDARYLADADLSVAIGRDAGASPYLDGSTLVAAAVTTGCDAVHPGFGFLAENADFARAVIDAGLIWIGPPPDAIEAMGFKVGAKRLAREAGVPVLESIEVTGDVDRAVREARESLRLPLLVKPSAGGGGKGMHQVDDFDELPDVLRRAEREAISSFSDGTLFVERYVETARHVEVQIVADGQGSVIHLGTRDCSIQRRHQKIVEEAPAPDLSETLAEQMCSSSVGLAKSIGYVGAGTVEFLVFGEEYAFLEMNTRLQVEHPVTEEVTGVDLVDLQFVVASGGELGLEQSDVTMRGHAIEVRLYAENPAENFLPSPGTISVFWTPDLPGVRWETGVEPGSAVSPRYDPMIAKIISSGRDREEATARLSRALRLMRVGGVKTNRELLVAILREPDFVSSRLATRFLLDHPHVITAGLDRSVIDLHLVGAVLAGVHERRSAAEVQQFAPPRWRNVRGRDAVQTLLVDGDTVVVRYAPARHVDSAWTVHVDDREIKVDRAIVRGDRVDLIVEGLRTSLTVEQVTSETIVSSAEGQTTVVMWEPLREDSAVAAGTLVSPLPGIVVEVMYSVGDTVSAGDCLLAIEAMKMEHRILAPADGVVSEIFVKIGDTVEHDQTLAAIGES